VQPGVAIVHPTIGFQVASVHSIDVSAMTGILQELKESDKSRLNNAELLGLSRDNIA
jgi:hypothetical protein